MKAHLLLYAVGFALWFAALPQAPAAESLFTDMDLFTSGHDNVNIYRSPSLVVAPSGTILAFIEASEGDDGDPTDLTLKRNPDTRPQPLRMFNGYPRVFGYGVNWEPMRIVLPGQGADAHSQARRWRPCGHIRNGGKKPQEARSDSCIQCRGGSKFLSVERRSQVRISPHRQFREGKPDAANNDRHGRRHG